MPPIPRSPRSRPPYPRSAAAWLTAALALLCAACSGGGIAVGPVTLIRPAATATAGEPSVAISAGAPIVPSSTTPQIPPASDGRSLVPIADYNGGIVLRAGAPGQPATAAGYEVWNPSTGALQPLPNWPAGSEDRVVGATGAWLVLLRPTAPASAAPAAGAVVLLDPSSGETRTLGTTAESFGAPAIAVGDGWVAWAGDGSQPGLHAYDLANFTDHLLPVRARGITRLAVGGGSIAWWQRYGPQGSQGSQVVVRTIATGQTRTIATGPVDALVLSSDGQTLAWLRDAASGEPGLFLSDLSTGETGRLLGGQTVGVSLSASGSYIAWQPDPVSGSNASNVAGTYNVRTHELRLVQAPAGTATRLARVLGNWFVWAARPNASQGSGQPPPASSPTYVFPLAG